MESIVDTILENLEFFENRIEKIESEKMTRIFDFLKCNNLDEEEGQRDLKTFIFEHSRIFIRVKVKRAVTKRSLDKKRKIESTKLNLQDLVEML